jgi:GAF domain-containing protein
MPESATPRGIIVGLLSIGVTPDDVSRLFDLIVNEAPKLVGARECSIFWKEGPWRAQWRQRNDDLIPDAFFRRATYKEKQALIGKDYYRPGQPDEGLTGWVARHGKSLRIDDITDQEELKRIDPNLCWADKNRGFHDSRDPDRQRAFLAVPVIIEREVAGVIRIAKTEEPRGKFTEEAQDLLETFANHVGAVIKRVEEAHLKVLWDELYLSGVTLAKDKFGGYLQRVVDHVPRYMDACGCSIFLLEQETEGRRILTLRATTTNGPLASLVGEATYELGEGLTGWVAKHNRSLRIRDVDDGTELQVISSDLRHLGKHEEWVHHHSSFLAAPIQRGEKVFGVMRISQDSQGKLFSSSDERLVNYFCQNLAVLVENVQLFENLQLGSDKLKERLSQTRAQLKELSAPLMKDINTIRERLDTLSRPEDALRCFKFGGKCTKGRIETENTVFVGIPFSSAYYKDLWEYALEPAIRESGLSPWIAFEERSVRDLMCKICEGIQKSRFGVIDISEWNANVLFELGLLYGLGRAVILLKREDAAVLVDLAGFEYLSYGQFDQLRQQLAAQISKLRLERD